MKRQTPFLLLAALLCIVPLAGAAETNTPPSTATNTAARATLPKLVDLGANKCIPCKKMAPILEALKTDFAGQMEVEFIDVWENRDAGKKYKVLLIPTQIFFDAAGKELFRHEGFYSREDIVAKWKELGVSLAEPRKE
jgi:thioredoxin 1